MERREEQNAEEDFHTVKFLEDALNGARAAAAAHLDVEFVVVF
jgi:hypothetical protein